MKLGKTLLLGAALAMCGVPAAQAGTKTMASAPASRFYPLAQDLACNIVNADDAPHQVTIETMDYSGNVIAGPYVTVLNPGQGDTLTDTLNVSSWCRFTVDGSTKKYRAAAVYGAGTAYTVNLPAY